MIKLFFNQHDKQYKTIINNASFKQKNNNTKSKNLKQYNKH